MKQMKRSPSAILLSVTLLIAGVLFMLSARTPFTLVLQIKSLEKGPRQIVVTAQSGKESRIAFDIGSDSGESAVYTFELPRTPLKAVTIPPLAAPGRFEVEQITLSNQAVIYRWAGAADCRRRLASDPVGQYSACLPTSPALTTNENAAITIAEIPDEGMTESIPVRFCTALLAAFLFLAAAFYLLRPVPDGGEYTKVAVERGGWLLFIALYLWQFLMLWRYSVDLPFWEEWEFFEPAALQRGLTLDWLFCHFGTNQQVVVFTKLMAWLDFKLFSLDFARLKLMNYLVFGLFLATVVKLARQVTGSSFRLLPLFMLFLVSPLAYEAHAASFQSGEVFVLLFATVMLCYSAPEKPGVAESCFFSAAAIGAVFSMHTGVAVAGILLAGRSVFIACRMLSGEAEKRTAVTSLIISWLLTLMAIGFWLSGFKNPAEASPRLLPTEGRFWGQFFDLLSFGFGFEAANPFPGPVILLFLLTPLILLLFAEKSRWQGSTWKILQAIIILLTITAMITFGRGATFTTLKLSRYAVYLSPLIPLGAVAWWRALQGRKELRWVLAGFWIFCCAGYSNNWSYAIYRDLQQMDLATLECVDAYNRGFGDGNCPDTHGVPIGGFFDNARNLGINFTRRFVRPSQPK